MLAGQPPPTKGTRVHCVAMRTPLEQSGSARRCAVLALGMSFALATGAVVTIPASAAPAPVAVKPSPGSPGIGDRLYPRLGNGGYDVRHYALDVRYPTKNPKQTVTGNVLISATATQALSSFDLDFSGRSVGSVAVNGRVARWSWLKGELKVTPRFALRAGSAFTVKVAGFTATPTVPGKGALLDAPFFSTPDGSALAGQPDGAHRYFPSNDHPRDKATYSFSILAPKGWIAVANGVLTGSAAAGGGTRWRYVQRQPMASELTQIAVGDFRLTNWGSSDGVVLRDVTPRRLTAALHPRLAVEASQLNWMRSRVGPYPFDTYGSLVVDSPLGFALETQTLSLYTADFFNRKVPDAALNPILLHELSHQWFGDSVSPSSWSDVWQNEGHATWYELTYAQDQDYLPKVYGAKDLDDLMRQVYAASDSLRAQYGPVARPIGGSTGALFNPNVYYGGALALYALRQEIGTAAFDQLERQWIARNRGASRSTDDFIALASKVSAKDLRTFLIAWLYGTRTPPMPGHPEWTVTPVPHTTAAARRVAAARANAASPFTRRLATRIALIQAR